LAQPDDHDDPRGRSPDPAAAFEQIIAGLRAEGGMPVWPEERAAPLTSPARQHRPDPAPERTRVDRPESDRPESDRAESDRAGPDRAGPDRAGPDRGEPPASIAPEDDHFVPPDPPPLPPLGQQAAVGVALLALGVLLVVAPDLLGLSEAAGLTLGLVTLAGGLGWLVLRSWSTDPPDDADPIDDGARF
jgi:hypothetical protein